MNTWRSDEPEEKKYYGTVCVDCKWEDPELHREQGDCTISLCPDCGSEYLVDEEIWK